MTSSDRDADFSAFVAAYRVRLVQAALLLTGGRYAEAEDLVQGVLMRLYAKWSRVQRVEEPVGYALRAITNAFLDERRSAYRRREVVSTHRPEREASPDPTSRGDVHSVVMDALRELAPRQRAVVVLRHFLGYDVAATATLLGCAQGTVKSQNAKALERLRELLGDQIESEELHP